MSSRASCAFLALAGLVAACTGSGGGGARFSVGPSPGASGAPSAAASPRTVGDARLLDRAPRASLFAGSASAAGIAVRYCLRADCAVRPGGTPRFVEAPAGAAVIFALGDSPVEAGLDVRPAAGGQTTRIALNPGTVMSYQVALAPGRHLVTLVARFAAAEAQWLFGLDVEG